MQYALSRVVLPLEDHLSVNSILRRGHLFTYSFTYSKRDSIVLWIGACGISAPIWIWALGGIRHDALSIEYSHSLGCTFDVWIHVSVRHSPTPPGWCFRQKKNEQVVQRESDPKHLAHTPTREKRIA